ncbi:VgrG-related protein [Streptomyces sp. NPDC056663]|uniref:VgrG-related protein n=1 Tax=Streptomyces sp. NPDC056663 TaxID=3345899 RepID=UPI0036AA03A1
MAEPAFSSVIDVEIGKTKLPAAYASRLVDCHIDQGIGVPASFRLTFRDEYRDMLDDNLGITFGTKVVLTPIANGKGAADPLLTGEVTGLEADYDGTGSYTVIRGYDLSHRLLRQRRVAAYSMQRASDIVRTLAVKADVPIGKIDVTTTMYKFISQSNVTDWDFVARLADENEMVMSMDGEGTLQFVKPKPASRAPSPKTDGDNVLKRRHILRLRAAATAADQVGTFEVRGWDVTGKRELKATVRAASNPAITIGTSSAEIAERFKPATLVATDTPYDKQTEVKFAADALAADVTGSFAELEVVVHGNPKLRPGVPVALADVGKPFEGKYTVTSVRHEFGPKKHYESWLTVSGRQWRSLYGLASGSADTTPRLPSVANAIVDDVTDPLRQGRVKLRFPWLDDAYVSDWTRTVQLGGKSGGGFFPLDVNDEVLVAFDRGALDHPFVIGGLYNGMDKPTADPEKVPLYDASAKNVAVRHTLSDRDGNRVDLLSQKTGRRKQGVRIASGDNKLKINLDRTNTEITVDSDGSVSIKGSKSVSVEAGTDLTLSARRELTIKSGGRLSIEGGGIVNMRSAGEFGVNAGGALNLSSAAVTSIKSATVSIGPGNVSIGPGNVSIGAGNVMLLGVVTANGTPVL